MVTCADSKTKMYKVLTSILKEINTYLLGRIIYVSKGPSDTPSNALSFAT